MATFATAVARLLRTINRPSTETDVVLGVKDAINDAIRTLQRDHAFVYTESLAQVAIPADALYVDLAEICSGYVRDFISVQQVSANQYQGKPLRFISYSQVQTKRMKYYRKHGANQDQSFVDNQLGMTIEDGFRNDLIAFISNRYIGVYPKQAAEVTLLLHFHIWIPELIADDDTNFFLDHAYDLVMLLALKNMSYFMKSDNRINVDNVDIAARMTSLLTWDSQLRESTNRTLE